MRMDIVATLNQYRMCIVPEEAIGLPGMTFVEAMACGCAFIGVRGPMYSELGLADRVNYVGYDGSMRDLIATIAYYQDHEAELEAIATRGHDFVAVNLTTPRVMSNFLSQLQRMVGERAVTRR